MLYHPQDSILSLAPVGVSLEEQGTLVRSKLSISTRTATLITAIYVAVRLQSRKHLTSLVSPTLAWRKFLG